MTSSSDKLEYYEHLGDYLKVSREKRSVDLLQASEVTRIHVRHLQALETGEYEALPAPVYIQGYLRTYAEFLDLEPEEVVHRFKQDKHLLPTPKSTFHAPEPVEPKYWPDPWVLVMSALLFLAIYAFWYFNNRTDVAPADATREEPAVQQQAFQTGLTADKLGSWLAGESWLWRHIDSGETEWEEASVTDPMALQLPLAESVEDGLQVIEAELALLAPYQRWNLEFSPWTFGTETAHRIVLFTDDLALIKLTDLQGHAYIDGFMQKGGAYFVPNRPGLFLEASDGAAPVLFVDGERIRPLGYPGMVLEKIALDAPSLLKKYGY